MQQLDAVSYHYCGIHNHTGSGRCPLCALGTDVSYVGDRIDAQGSALNNMSRRIDLVSDQSDRQDTALTELESHLLDQQDAHNQLVVYAERVNDRVSWLRDATARRFDRQSRRLRADFYRALDAQNNRLAEDNRSLVHRVGELEDQLGILLRLFVEHAHAAP